MMEDAPVSFKTFALHWQDHRDYGTNLPFLGPLHQKTQMRHLPRLPIPRSTCISVQCSGALITEDHWPHRGTKCGYYSFKNIEDAWNEAMNYCRMRFITGTRSVAICQIDNYGHWVETERGYRSEYIRLLGVVLAGRGDLDRQTPVPIIRSVPHSLELANFYGIDYIGQRFETPSPSEQIEAFKEQNERYLERFKQNLLSQPQTDLWYQERSTKSFDAKAVETYIETWLKTHPGQEGSAGT